MEFIKKAAPRLEEFKALNFGRLSFKKFARKTEKQAAIIQRTQFFVGVKFFVLHTSIATSSSPTVSIVRTRLCGDGYDTVHGDEK